MGVREGYLVAHLHARASYCKTPYFSTRSLCNSKSIIIIIMDATMSMSASTVCFNSAINVLLFGCRGSCFIADTQRIRKEILAHGYILVL